MAIPAASQSAADWSPTLAKIEDGRLILDVSSSSESDDTFLRREGERIAERDERNRILMEEMRQIDIGAGEPVVIPNDAGYEQVVQDFYQDDEGPGDQNDEDEGISEN